ncbi:MAG TPA: hypothetical protein VIP77_15595 [Jiangellaceae bacterium]
MNAIRFWLGFVGWSAATLLEIPLHARRRLLVAQDRVEDARDVFEESDDA